VFIHLLKSQLPTQSELVPMYEYMAAVSFCEEQECSEVEKMG
jgi:hypothetical protein